MFIRKRTYGVKRQRAHGVSYQVLESYRENGKVKHRVVYNLGHNATPEEALAEARMYFANCEESMREIEDAEKRDGKSRKDSIFWKWPHEASLKWKSRIEKLENVVSEFRDVITL